MRPVTCLCVSLLSFALAAPAAQADEKPNVLFLLADDWRFDTLGSINPTVVTPNLDQLAKEGVLFDQCRVTTSICCVSRASFLTGQHMARHGIERFGVPIPDQAWADTYPGRFRSAGYVNAFVGKYGVGKPPVDQFEFIRTYEGRHWYPDGQGGRIHITERNAQDSLEFLKTRPKDKPFCLSVSFFAPHAEDRAPEQYLPQPWSAKHYQGKTVPVPKLASDKALANLPYFLSDEKNEGRVRWRKRFDTPEKFQEYMTNYYRLCTEVDEVIGRLIQELKSQGIYDNTVIVFTGDNGYFHADRGLADKWYPYEESLRIPLIIRDPKTKPALRGTTSEAFVLNIDIPATLLDLAGLPVPKVMQGESIAPWLTEQPPSNWRSEFYYQHPVIIAKDRIPQSEAVVRRDWKYSYWPDFDYEELYDLKADPLEQNNLANDNAASAKKKQLQAKLAELSEAAK